ncbi:transaldolase [Campylobacter pinnipediorum subsp. caledonicus]|uniref:transaldolase n=1 Tax=Campylobacter pinnipediorum TaxID=1965231 RepID=UPI000995934B|nr:transaldolase [Campylobacter pinnipediorum]OPA70548.1 transaldolase [Campylobacter pinnipediorum subsp. caledonicus]
MYNKNINFSLWCDFIEREFLNNEFVDLISKDIINGATSNPAIFKSAFVGSEAYKTAIKNSHKRHPKDIYETLATQDIKMAACKLLKNYANNDDGFVSIEVDPNLHDNVNATVEEGKRLHQMIKMPNVMIKVPATKEVFEAMSALMADGISVNATLIFSPEQARGCLDAFKDGVAQYQKRFVNTMLPQGVISIFVSRFDRLLDDKMQEKSLPKSQIGIMNATKIYHMIKDENLSNVRALFASTGVKGNELRADYYVRELMFENTINTAPLDTIKEFIKQKAEPKVATSKENVDSFFSVLKNANIDLQTAYRDLLNDGLKAFVVAFDDILKGLK